MTFTTAVVQGLHATPSSAEEAEARLAEAYGKSR